MTATEAVRGRELDAALDAFWGQRGDRAGMQSALAAVEPLIRERLAQEEFDRISDVLDVCLCVEHVDEVRQQLANYEKIANLHRLDDRGWCAECLTSPCAAARIVRGDAS